MFYFVNQCQQWKKVKICPFSYSANAPKKQHKFILPLKLCNTLQPNATHIIDAKNVDSSKENDRLPQKFVLAFALYFKMTMFCPF